VYSNTVLIRRMQGTSTECKAVRRMVVNESEKKTYGIV